ncbi:MAG: phytanoyl-CoA dioxygenase family protein [Pseudomonadota bacterium]
MTRSLATEFESSGRVWLRNAVSEEDLKLFDNSTTASTKAGQRLEVSKQLKAARSEEGSLIRAVQSLSPNAVPVRIVAFNKSESANWGVPWHQDRVIAVSQKAEIAGYKNWTKKSGAWHCEPPLSILDEMLFVRIHLDDNDQSNGAMEIAVGSHSNGFVHSAKAEQVANTHPIETCVAKRGDVLILKMLTLHSEVLPDPWTGSGGF